MRWRRGDVWRGGEGSSSECAPRIIGAAAVLRGCHVRKDHVRRTSGEVSPGWRRPPPPRHWPQRHWRVDAPSPDFRGATGATVPVYPSDFGLEAARARSIVGLRPAPPTAPSLPWSGKSVRLAHRMVRGRPASSMTSRTWPGGSAQGNLHRADRGGRPSTASGSIGGEAERLEPDRPDSAAEDECACHRARQRSITFAGTQEQDVERVVAGRTRIVLGSAAKKNCFSDRCRPREENRPPDRARSGLNPREGVFQHGRRPRRVPGWAGPRMRLPAPPGLVDFARACGTR